MSAVVMPTPVEYADPHYALHADGSRVERLEDITRRRAAATPDASAVRTTTSTTTYAELDREASRVANALIAAGVTVGDRVAYLGENSAAFLATLYGASKAGAIPTALNFRLAPGEVDYILRDAEPAALILGAGHEHLAPTALEAGVRLVITLTTPPPTGPADPSAGAASGRVVGGAAAAERGMTVGYDSWAGAASAVDPGFSRDPGETALMFYTSGTTGHPKGIELTGANLGQAVAAMHYLLELDTTSVALAPVPFFHVSGLGLALVAAINGSSLLLRNPTSSADLCAILQEEHVSHAVAVPTVIQFLLTLPEVRTGDWSALKYLVYGASPMPEPVLREATAVFGCKFLQSYGLTESTGGVTMLSPDDHRTASKLRSVGRPMPNVPVRVVDPITLEDLPPGQRGEVLIGGGHVMRRYWRNPTATEAAITPDGWLRTGDGGSFDEDGYLYLHDRLKDMIVSGGENVYPAEVESVLTGHPSVAHVAVVGVPSARWGESPLAVVVAAAGATIDGDELIAWARDRLAHYKCPTAVVVVDALPLTASGKVLKTSLRGQYGGARRG